MSKIGRFNLELQERANELGFSTTQEALDNGYHVVEDLVTGDVMLKKLDEQELAHEAWLKEKKYALLALKTMKKDLHEASKTGKMDICAAGHNEENVEYVIEFIEGVSHE